MLRKSIIIVSLVVYSSLFFFCKSNTSNKEVPKKNTVVTFKEQEVTTQIYNDDKSMLLVLNYVIEKSPIITYSYKVIDLKTREELKKGVFIGQKIEWLDRSSLKCIHHVGMVRKEDDQLLLTGKDRSNMNYTVIKIN
jgi:hypothetical protein